MSFNRREYMKEYKKKYRQENKEYIKEYYRKYCQEHKEELQEYHRKYNQEHKEEIKKYNEEHKEEKRALDRLYQNTDKWRKYNREYQAMRKATDPNFKLRHNIRTFIRSKHKSTKKSLEILGCNVDTFKKWIEGHFQEGMTWENYGNGAGKWNYDHIIPITWFDCTDEEQLLKANHYTNIKPMWSIENIKKSNKYAG